MIDNVSIPEDFNLPARQTLEQKKKDDTLFDEALALIKEKNALLIAHYYTSETMQRLCEAAGGFIGDSLEMARMGRDSDKNLIVAHPEATVVAYANTSAAVKAQADWIVTSSLAVELGKYLTSKGEPILWVPDRHLGSYIANQSSSDVYCWPGRCIVHDAFEANALEFVKKENPDAMVLVHPEAPAAVVERADYVGSTSQILAFAKSSDCKKFIIATERNIFYKLSCACPDKKFIEAPVASTKGHCISCANCPWMELNSLESLIKALNNPSSHALDVDESVRVKALKPLERMLNFSADLKSGKIVLN